MPMYNVAPFVKQALDSILNQTVSAQEIIIVDDDSTDDSVSLIKAYQQAFPHIKLIQLFNKKPGERRTAAALNIALKEAKNEFIAWMDADDVCHCDRFETQIDYLQTHGDVMACGTQATTLQSQWYKPARKLELPVDDAWLKLFCLRQSPFFQSSVMARKSFLLQHDLTYNESYAYAEDYEFFSRLALKGVIANLPVYTLRYRMHGAQSIKTKAFETTVVSIIERNVNALLGYCNMDLVRLLNHRSTATLEELIASFHTAISLQELLYTKTEYNKKIIDAFIAYTWKRKILHALNTNPHWLQQIKRNESHLLATLTTMERIRIAAKRMI